MVQRGVDPVAQVVGFDIGESPVEWPQHEPDQDVGLARARLEAFAYL